MNEKTKAKIRKNNMKLHPIYEMLGLDYLFLYGIEILFLTQVKGFTNSEALLTSTIYAVFCICLQIPIVAVVNKLGTRKAMVIRKYIQNDIHSSNYYL